MHKKKREEIRLATLYLVLVPLKKTLYSLSYFIIMPYVCLYFIILCVLCDDSKAQKKVLQNV